MKKFIYQDPRRPRFKSRPIDESDTKARAILEGSGWRVVETIDDSVEAAPVADVAPAAGGVSVETGKAPAAAPQAPRKGKGKRGAAAAPQAPAEPPAEPAGEPKA